MLVTAVRSIATHWFQFTVHIARAWVWTWEFTFAALHSWVFTTTPLCKSALRGTMRSHCVSCCCWTRSSVSYISKAPHLKVWDGRHPAGAAGSYSLPTCLFSHFLALGLCFCFRLLALLLQKLKTMTAKCWESERKVADLREWSTLKNTILPQLVLQCPQPYPCVYRRHCFRIKRTISC